MGVHCLISRGRCKWLCWVTLHRQIIWPFLIWQTRVTNTEKFAQEITSKEIPYSTLNPNSDSIHFFVTKLNAALIFWKDITKLFFRACSFFSTKIGNNNICQFFYVIRTQPASERIITCGNNNSCVTAFCFVLWKGIFLFWYICSLLT